jgi:hypothetical protein
MQLYCGMVHRGGKNCETAETCGRDQHPLSFQLKFPGDGEWGLFFSVRLKKS